MQLFTQDEFRSYYQGDGEFENATIPTWEIEAVSEMIFSQIGLRYRDASWDETSVPLPIKKACMEQMRFMIAHNIPFVDYKEEIRAGNMEARLSSDYSTLALRILANNGYLYRGSRMSDNMALTIPFGE